MVVHVRGPEFAPVHVEVADDLSSWRAEVPGRVRAVGEALSGPTTPPGARVQLLNPPGSEVGPGQIATWGVATADPGGRSGLLLHLGVGRPFEQAHPVRLEWPGRVSPSKGPGQGSLSGAKQGDPLASLSRQIIVAVTAWLLACAAVAWVLVARQADTMSGMVSGLAPRWARGCR